MAVGAGSGKINSARAGDTEPPKLKTVVRPVVNALSILRYLANGRSVTATRLARDLRINTSTCFNILRTLVNEEAIVFDRVGKSYKIGPAILQLVSSAISEESRLATIKPMLQQFAREHRATLCVWRRSTPMRNSLITVEYGESAVRIHLSIGQRLPALLGSTGRSIAQYLDLPKREIRAEFKKLKWHRPPDFETFWEESLLAKGRGWAMDQENFTPGVVTISAPIIGTSGAINYTLTILTFRGQHSERELSLIGAKLKDLAVRMGEVFE